MLEREGKRKSGNKVVGGAQVKVVAEAMVRWSEMIEACADFYVDQCLTQDWRKIKQRVGIGKRQRGDRVKAEEMACVLDQIFRPGEVWTGGRVKYYFVCS